MPSQVVNRCITDMAVFDFVTEGPEAPLAPSNIFGFAVFATTSLHLLTLFIKTLMLVLVLVLVLVVFCPFLFFMCFLFFLFLELIPGSDTFSSRLSGPDPTTCSSSSVCFLLILWEKSPTFMLIIPMFMVFVLTFVLFLLLVAVVLVVVLNFPDSS